MSIFLIALQLLPLPVQLVIAQEVILEIPDQIELRVGETYTLEFPGLGAAGYLWTYEILENGNLLDILTEARSAQSVNEEDSPSVGSSANEFFTLKALEVGHSRVRFVQRRPWEQNQPPLKEHILDVKIHK